MAQLSSALDYVQPSTPPLTPPSSPAPDNGFPLLTMLPTQLLKHPARLAIECYHRRKFSKATLPEAALYEHSRNIAEDEPRQALCILSIFTLNVNASALLSTIELPEPECEELSNSFLPDMIHANCAAFCAQYSRFVGVELEGWRFKDRIWELLDDLDYYFMELMVAEVS